MAKKIKQRDITLPFLAGISIKKNYWDINTCVVSRETSDEKFYAMTRLGDQDIYVCPRIISAS